jgi:hypothetical protein
LKKPNSINESSANYFEISYKFWEQKSLETFAPPILKLCAANNSSSLICILRLLIKLNRFLFNSKGVA